MTPLRVYVDTSVFGGTKDSEFEQASGLFFQRVRHGEIIILISPMVLRELYYAPEEIQGILRGLPEELVSFVADSKTIQHLADQYIQAGILQPASRDDAIHIATATVAQADVIVSWNFKHIVNFDRIQRYNEVNKRMGMPAIDIRSPEELAYGYRNEDL